MKTERDHPPNSVVSAPDYYRISPDATDREFLAVAKLYARQVVQEHALSVDVSDIGWEVSKRAKRRGGAVRHVDGEPETVSLTWTYFEEHGWAGIAEIIRHELIHVHLLNERGDGTHGEAFKRLADALDTTVYCDRFTSPEWWVLCDNCGKRLARYRRSKLVKNPEAYRCGSCGAALRVEENESDEDDR